MRIQGRAERLCQGGKGGGSGKWVGFGVESEEVRGSAYGLVASESEVTPGDSA